MSKLEPTYLRYIYDGLIKGSVHPENAAELPEGLIGLYEEAFDERTSAVDRQKLLRRFAIWALLKKEVSAQFVAEVLEEREEDIIDFISTYSAWFNSPENGKYQLYHERLKVYLLQKLSEGEVSVLHEKLIANLENAIFNHQEFIEYGNEFQIYHIALQSIFNSHFKINLTKLLKDQNFIDRIVLHRTDRRLVMGSLSFSLNLCVYDEDWYTMEKMVSATLHFHHKLRNQIIEDLKWVNSDWGILYDHFDSAPDNEEKLRLFFLIICLDRNWLDERFKRITEIVRLIAEEEYINLAEIAPLWLVQRANSIFQENKNIGFLLEEADHDELTTFSKLSPNFIYMIDKLSSYPHHYRNEYTKTIEKLSSSTLLDEKDFLDLFNQISTGNLISRDEVLCRVTVEVLNNHLENENCINWFFWLIGKSNFEIGEYSWGRINTIELCILYLKKTTIDFHLRLLVVLDEIGIDYHNIIKLRNYISQSFFEQKDKDNANAALLKIGSTKGNEFSKSKWIMQWLLHDPQARLINLDLLDPLDRLELSYNEFLLNRNKTNIDFRNSKTYTYLFALDTVSRAEYLAEFAVKIENDDLHLSRQMIQEGWDLVEKADDWAVFFSKISVYTSALNIMPRPWIQANFNSLKRNFSRYEVDETSTHLSETLFQTKAFRFSQNGPYQKIKSDYPEIFHYLKTKFIESVSKAEEELNFQQFLTFELNAFNSIKAMWKNAKHYFKSGCPGENFIFFWNFITEESNLFNNFTSEDTRVINVISNKIGLRFPFEKFKGRNKKIEYYSRRFVIPDNYNLGLTEGLESMAKFEKELEFDNGFRIVFSAALEGSSDRLKKVDWINEPLSPLAYATKKVIPFEDDMRMIKNFLEVRKMLENPLV
jgi:hypothetical protein